MIEPARFGDSAVSDLFATCSARNLSTMMPSQSETLLYLIVALSFLAVVLFLFLVKAAARARRYDTMASYLNTVIDSANEGLYVTDKQRRFLLWNGAAERITGYRKDEIIGRYCHDNILCHTDGNGRQICRSGCPLHDAVETGVVHGPDIVYLRQRSGRTIPVEIETAPLFGSDGKVVGGIELFRDVTARLEHERHLRERKEKLETVLDSISEGVLFLDTAGAIAVFNHACSELFGLSRAVLGTPLHLMPEDMSLRKALASAESGLHAFIERYGIRQDSIECCGAGSTNRCWNTGMSGRASGSRSDCYICETYQAAKIYLEKPRELAWGDRTFSVVSSFIESWETNELWEIMTFRDVTAEKLDAVLKLAGAAAHELRQPLQVLMMLAGILRNGHRGERASAEYVDILETSCSRMNKIIQQMGDISAYRTKEYLEGAQILDIDHS